MTSSPSMTYSLRRGHESRTPDRLRTLDRICESSQAALAADPRRARVHHGARPRAGLGAACLRTVALRLSDERADGRHADDKLPDTFTSRSLMNMRLLPKEPVMLRDTTGQDRMIERQSSWKRHRTLILGVLAAVVGAAVLLTYVLRYSGAGVSVDRSRLTIAPV